MALSGFSTRMLSLSESNAAPHRILRAAASAGGGARSGRAGHLDYGIDGPLSGGGEVNVDFSAVTSSDAGHTVALEEPVHKAQDTLPFFMRNAAAPSTPAVRRLVTAYSCVCVRP